MKKIIIGTPSLISGGVEVSLVRFIKELSKNKNYKITLLLLKREGIYLNSIPKNVSIITLEYINDMYSFNRKMKDVTNIKGINNKLKFIMYRLKLRYFVKKDRWSDYYNLVLSKTKCVEGEYDLAIDWHGYGNFITSVIASKVNSLKKATWIHAEKTEWLKNVLPWLDTFDKIFCVSKSCKKNLMSYERISSKLDVFYNMTDYSNVIKKANNGKSFNFDKNRLNMVTVGRLVYDKGYDLLLDIATDLKKQNILFEWVIIGGGPLKEEIEKEIDERGLNDNVKLLGVLKNPYPIIKDADLYIQPSRNEGYGLAIEEARMLKKVVIATDLDCIKEQIRDGVNGFLCSFDVSSFSNKIIEVSKNKNLIKKVIDNLNKDSFDRTGELKKIDKLLEEK